MKHLFLVGFTGVGKTTTGMQLAKAMDRPFIDLDAYIEKKTGRLIRDIFAEDGESSFRRIESEALEELLTELKEPSVIASGGGTPCFNDNMSTMKTHGVVIYLQADAQKIRENLEKSSKMGQIRPLFLPEKGEISLDQINFLLKKRIHYYEQSHAICGIESIQISDLLTIATDLLTKSPE